MSLIKFSIEINQYMYQEKEYANSYYYFLDVRMFFQYEDSQKRGWRNGFSDRIHRDRYDILCMLQCL